MKTVWKNWPWLVVALLLIFTNAAQPQSKPLRIAFPMAGTRVSGPVIELTGDGADPKGQLEVSVLTNDWYVQNGTATINADGSWSYAPCFVSGQGKFNNHTIRVTVIKDGKRLQTATVRGVVRRE